MSDPSECPPFEVDKPLTVQQKQEKEVGCQPNDQAQFDEFQQHFRDERREEEITQNDFEHYGSSMGQKNQEEEEGSEKSVQDHHHLEGDSLNNEKNHVVQEVHEQVVEKSEQPPELLKENLPNQQIKDNSKEEQILKETEEVITSDKVEAVNDNKIQQKIESAVEKGTCVGEENKNSIQIAEKKEAQELPPQQKKDSNIAENILGSDKLESAKQIPTQVIKCSSIIKQAEQERVGSIYQQFCNYNASLQKTIASYKIILKNVCSELQNKRDEKKSLQSSLINYFEEYSRIHRLFHEKGSKFPKEAQEQSVNKFANMKEDLRRGFEQLLYLRKNVGVDAHKLDSYINNYVIKSIQQLFQAYREEISAEERRQLTPKDDFLTEEKTFKKLVANLDKICKKGKEGIKTKDDLFVELVSFINQEITFKKALVKTGKTTIELRKGYIMAEKKLFEELSKLMNDFKNEQKIVYTASKEFNFVEDYSAPIATAYQYKDLCTITDVDYIRGVLGLNAKKSKIQFTDQHYQNYLQLPFFQAEVGKAIDLLKGSMVKIFPLQKQNHILVHTISQNLVEYDKEKNESKDVYQLAKINAKIFAEGAVQFEVVSGLIFKESKTVRVQFRDSDCAQELISYLNEIQEIKEDKGDS